MFSRSFVAATAAAVLAVTGLSTPAHAAKSPDGLMLVATHQSLLGTHTWYQQTYSGIPVLGGFYATHTDSRTGTVSTDDGRVAVSGVPALTATFGSDRARARVAGAALRTGLVIVPGAHATLAWELLSDRSGRSVRTLVDARSGVLLKEEPLVKEATGTGKVFEPNPVVTLQNEGLTDNGNKDSATFTPAYKTVTLTQLDSSGNLIGAYAKNTSSSAVNSSTHTYNYNRSQKQFEQVMGYYHITRAQEYIQSLGFTNVNNSAQKYRTTGLTDDNSFYDPSTDQITYGTGGVDDAEDAEVIWHEYGHAIQDAQVPGFGSTEEAGAIGEGFGDYWAFTMSAAVSTSTSTTPLACIADWDSVSYTSGTPHCLRRVDGTKVYPGGKDGEVHDDGEIWSRALFDIYNALGRTQTDKIILEGQFSFSPSTTMPAAASKIVAAAQSLYGTTAANAATTAFHNRGIL
ncbi:M36 family metallopeptidase [Hamadaea tsunoensis]|uniref:M36 family metallopeptidase n=1 Tax=Hamadaea tsunoensis TaxID=53368 RepID=UPI000553868C|nr:M36 family metallopeptidase [Hamadaea tsunoensis]